jgi:hypothetical protein
MSDLEVFIEGLEADVKKAEEGMVQANAQVAQWTSTVHGLTGMLQANRKSLEDAKKLLASRQEPEVPPEPEAPPAPETPVA